MSDQTGATDMSEPTKPDKKQRRITRRQFLIVAGASGAAALVGLRVLGLPYARLQIANYLESSGGPPIGVKAVPTAWFEILPDNTVRLFLPKVEMGQGVHTALAQAAADELEAAWENLEVLSAATGQGLDDPVGTSASNCSAWPWYNRASRLLSQRVIAGVPSPFSSLAASVRCPLA
jgi:isoquinoline 1-oxidoreductase subunit beta